MGAIDQRHAALVTDLLALPPTDASYEALKLRRLDRYGGSQTARLDRLLEYEELGDRQPSVVKTVCSK